MIANRSEIDPSHQRAFAAMLLVRAGSRIHDKQRDDALNDLAEALRLHPNLCDALMLRATIWVEMGEFDKALADVEKRLLLDPPDPAAVLTRGNLRACRGEHEQALADFTHYLEQEPATPIALRARAMTYLRLRRFEEAISDLNAALKMEPDQGEVYLERGRVCQDMGNYPAALADYQKALDLAPHEAAFHNQFAWMLAACPQQQYRDGVRAVQLARRGCELSRWQDPNLIDTLACGHAECGQFDEALRWASKSLESANAEVSAEVRKHIALFQRGRPARFEVDIP